MKNKSIRLRTTAGGQFHEFVTPSGQTVLIDPWFGFQNSEYLEGHSLDEISVPDYIILTHTHGDHDKDLRYFAEKYHPYIICPEHSAMALAKFHCLCFDDLFPVGHGQTLKFKDFTVQALPTKHVQMGFVYGPETEILGKVMPGHKECDDWGSMDSNDYCLTFDNGFQVFVSSGRDVLTASVEASGKICPDLLLRQAGMLYENHNMEKKRFTPEDYASYLVRYRAAVIMPMHYDGVVKGMGSAEKMHEYYNEVARLVAEKAPGTSFFFPKTWTWYTLGMDISEEK